MSLLKSKSSTEEKPSPVWFVVEREDFGATASTRATRAGAMDDFTAAVARAADEGAGYTPFQRGRRLAVIGPNVHVRAEDDDAVLLPFVDDEADDPLLVGDVALRAVLDAAEYALIVQKPIASALLES